MATIPGYITGIAQLGLDSILVKPKRSIGPFSAQVTIREVHNDELQITDHPVSQGATISDHAFMMPATVTIEASWSNSPSNSGIIAGLIAAGTATIEGVQSLLTGNSADQVRDMYAKLLSLQKSRILFDVYTGKRVYKNMLCRSLSTTTDKNSENSLVVIAELRELIVVSTQTLSVSAPPEQQQNPAITQPVTNRGTQALQPTTAWTPGSAGGGRGFVNPETVP